MRPLFYLLTMRDSENLRNAGNTFSSYESQVNLDSIFSFAKSFIGMWSLF